MDSTVYTVYIACLVGIASRVIIPFLVELKDKPETTFDKKFFLPVIVSVVINLLAAPLVLNTLPAGASWISAWIIGWGATDVSREAIKIAAGFVPALGGLK